MKRSPAKRAPRMSGHFKSVQIIQEASSVGWDCLLEGIKVPDMRKRYEPKTMQQRLRDEEPDVFDVTVSEEQYRDWIYGF